VDDNLGPVAVSVRREKTDGGGGSGTAAGKSSDAGACWLHQYRVIVRTSEVCCLIASLPVVL